jgi:hypothetical protein
MNSLELKVMEEFFIGYSTGCTKEYTIPAPFLKINCWSDLTVGGNMLVPLKLKSLCFVANTEK